jgi:signal peptide peptidase SppA
MFATLRQLMPASWRENHPLVPVVRLSGVIGAGSSFRSGLTLASVADTLERAFKLDAPAVVLAINSPGGSPVQSKLIHDRVRQLAEEEEREVIAVIDDAGASGGYMLACAGETILADPSSIVGSIGVVSAGFGFHEFIREHGIERRVYTAGKKKGILDPFQPENEEDVEHLKALQKDVHQVFIDLVKKSRGARLDESEDLFTGQFWSGVQAEKLGLVDDLQDLRSYLRSRFGDKVRMLPLIPGRVPFYKRLTGGGMEERALISIREAAHMLDERLLWARLGR